MRPLPAAAVLALVLAALAACGASEDSAVPATSSGPATTTTSASTPPAFALPSIKMPSAAQTAALLAALKAVDPDLVGDHAVQEARDTCLDVLQSEGADTLRRNVKLRFDDSSLSDAQADAILTAIKLSGWCKGS